MTLALFEPPEGEWLPLAPGAALLRGFCTGLGPALLQVVEEVTRQAPFRHLVTPGGLQMSVAMSNCGELGWVSDHRGYRYDPVDPDSGLPWPAMPQAFRDLAGQAALAAGYPDFRPDACLVNRYTPGARLSLHQDRDERDKGQPIVSVSLGVPAVFQFGGLARSERPARIALAHGDVVVWGGPSRLRYHGVLALQQARHPLTGDCRINLTFRKAA